MDELLRRILALALIGTAVWLVTVLAVQLGINGAVSIAAISALIVSVLALRRLPASRLGQHAVKVAFVLGLAALFVGEFFDTAEYTIERECGRVGVV